MKNVGPDWRRWLDAAKVLADNPTAQVLCPKNRDGYLEVTDHVTPGDSTQRERWMRCPVCGATNILRNPGG
jgi:hypothetical protein